MMTVISNKTSEANTPTTRDPAPLGVINESEQTLTKETPVRALLS